MSTQVTLYGGQFDGNVVDWPDGAATNTLVGEAGTRWTYALAADQATGALTGVENAEPPPVPPVTKISATDWLARFTPTEMLAVQTACLGNPTIQLGLTVGLAQGWIDLAQPRAAAWLALLVTAGAINSARLPTLLELP